MHFLLGPRFFLRKISFFPFLCLEHKTRISPFIFPHFQPNANYPREEGSGICEKEIMFFSFHFGVVAPYHCTLSLSLFRFRKSTSALSSAQGKEGRGKGKMKISQEGRKEIILQWKKILLLKNSNLFSSFSKNFSFFLGEENYMHHPYKFLFCRATKKPAKNLHFNMRSMYKGHYANGSISLVRSFDLRLDLLLLLLFFASNGL